jgi:hypothetical protein
MKENSEKIRDVLLLKNEWYNQLIEFGLGVVSVDV